jgi:hypothetical protein
VFAGKAGNSKQALLGLRSNFNLMSNYGTPVLQLGIPEKNNQPGTFI